MKTESHDLTTAEGWKAAIASLRGIPLVATMYAPHFWVADKIIDALTPGKASQRQAQAACDLIKEGKKNGVKKMTIVLDEKAGFDLDVPIEGVKVNASFGSKGKTTIDVEYA